MTKIKILDENVSNMIAAGEVVENPASMIKELLENSLDAESKNIEISVSNSGRNVKISDDGVGMSGDDLLLSIERHATSKIRTKDDLFNLFTYGFRGEALSSISAVSKLKIISRTKEDKIGNSINVLGGKITNIKEEKRNIGTTIDIQNLFFNTPARLKFLRKKTTEYANIKDMIIQEALASPSVAITLILDGKINIRTSGNGIDNTIIEIFGANSRKNMKKFDLGYLGNASLYRSNKDNIFTFVNNRMVKSKILQEAIIDGYYTKLMKGKYPFAILFLEIDPQEVDVNVHPSKKIVKFSNEDEIYKNVTSSIKESFAKDDVFISPTIEEKKEEKEKRFLDFSDFDEFEIFDEKENIKDNIFKEEKLKAEQPILVDFEMPKIHHRKEYDYFEINEVKKENELENQNKFIQKEIKGLDFQDDFKIQDFEKVKNLEFRVIGQVFDTFILVERDGIFEIYDQHIIHERILYEKLKKIYYDEDVISQNLLMPIKIMVSPKELAIIKENIDEFIKSGFEIESFGGNEILIRSIPSINFNDSIENIFREMIDSIQNKRYKDIRESILISMSCKGAIKAGHKLNQHEMEIMVRKIHEVGEYTCPHGRPIIVKISLVELEKMFKRKL